MIRLTDSEIENWASGRPTNPTTEQGVRMALEIQELRRRCLCRGTFRCTPCLEEIEAEESQPEGLSK